LRGQPRRAQPHRRKHQLEASSLWTDPRPAQRGAIVIQSTSLRRKLAGLTAAGSVITAVIAAVGFAWWDLNRFWQNTTAETTAVANIVADQVGAAMILGDAKAASELLSSLRSDQRIHDAVLYGSSGSCFAPFHRKLLRTC